MTATTDAATNTSKAYENFDVTLMAAEPPDGGFNVVARYANGTRMGVFRYTEVAEAVAALQAALHEEKPQESEVNACGAVLFDALFHESVRDAWREQWVLVRQSGRGVRLCITAQDPALVALLARWGFLWGGTFIVPDGNHFEYRRPPATAW
jgi:hypothetical protein